MGVDIATLGLRVDAGGLRAVPPELEKVAKAGDKAEKSVSGLDASMKKLAAAVSLVVLARQVQQAVLLAARYETLGIVTRRLGANSGFSAKQVGELEKALQRQGIAMVESRQALAQLIQAQVDLSKASDIARIAQDAAVIGGINSSEAFQRLTQGIQSGNLIVLRTIGLNVQWMKGYEDLAKELHKTTDDLTATEQIQARVNTVIAAGAQIAGTYEDAMGTAGKQLGSMTRLVDDLRVKLGQAGMPAFTLAVFGASQELKEMNKWVDANQQGIANFAAVAVSSMAAVFAPFAAFTRILFNIGNILVDLDRISKANLSGNFKERRAAYESLKSNLGDLGAALDANKTAWENLDATIAAGAPAVAASTAATRESEAALAARRAEMEAAAKAADDLAKADAAFEARLKKLNAEMGQANEIMNERLELLFAMSGAVASEADLVRDLARAFHEANAARPEHLSAAQASGPGIPSPALLDAINQEINAANRGLQTGAQAWNDIQALIAASGSTMEKMPTWVQEWSNSLLPVDKTITDIEIKMQAIAGAARVARRMIGGPIGAAVGSVIQTAGADIVNNPTASKGAAVSGALNANQVAIALAVGEKVVGIAAQLFFGGRSAQEIERERDLRLRANTAALTEASRNIEQMGSTLASSSVSQVEDFREVLAWLRGAGGGVLSSRLQATGQAFGVDTQGMTAEGMAAFAEAIEKALLEAARQVQLRLGSDFAARGADLDGNAAAAARIRREAAAAREIAELQKLAAAGFITAEQLAMFSDIIGRELTTALEDAAEAAKKLTRELTEGLTSRFFNATGASADAQRFALGVRHRQDFEALGDNPQAGPLITLVHQAERLQLEFELQTAAITEAANRQVAALDKQIGVAQSALAVAQDQLAEQERSVEVTRRVIESLDNFANSLNLGQFSPLSPAQKLDESRAQFDALSALALGGDVSAAESLPGAARALLEASQGFNASGAGFVADFLAVQSTVEQVRAQFAGQLTIDEQILAQLVSQTMSLQEQITALENQRQSVIDAAQAQIDELRLEHDAAMEVLRAQLQAAIDMANGIEDLVTDAAGRPRIDPNDWVFDTDPIVDAITDGIKILPPEWEWNTTTMNSKLDAQLEQSGRLLFSQLLYLEALFLDASGRPRINPNDFDFSTKAVEDAIAAQITESVRQHEINVDIWKAQLEAERAFVAGITDVATDMEKRPIIDPNDWVFDTTLMESKMDEQLAAVTASVEVLQTGFAEMIAWQERTRDSVDLTTAEVRRLEFRNDDTSTD